MSAVCACEHGAACTCVIPVVATDHPIWIEHGNELEDKHVTECMSPRVIPPQDEAEKTIEDKRGWSLPRVHTTAKEKHLRNNTHIQIHTQSIPL